MRPFALEEIELARLQAMRKRILDLRARIGQMKKIAPVRDLDRMIEQSQQSNFEPDESSNAA
jgi:hypothetical protein